MQELFEHELLEGELSEEEYEVRIPRLSHFYVPVLSHTLPSKCLEFIPGLYSCDALDCGYNNGTVDLVECLAFCTALPRRVQGLLLKEWHMNSQDAVVVLPDPSSDVAPHIPARDDRRAWLLAPRACAGHMDCLGRPAPRLRQGTALSRARLLVHKRKPLCRRP